MTKPPNPKRSGGPRTASGKLVSSSNALKTGVYSQSVVLPGENSEDFERLVSEFVDEYRPQGVTEAMLIRNVAVWWWRLLRLERMEHRHFLDRLSAPVRPFDLEASLGEIPDGVDDFLSNPDTIDNCDLEDYARYRQVARILLERKVLTGEQLEAVREREPFVFDFIAKRAEEEGFQSTAEAIAGARVRGAGIDYHPAWPLWVQDLVAECEQVAWAHQHRDQIIKVQSEIKEKRLYILVSEVLPRSAFDHVNRSLHRALDELRRHQSWRRKSREIDVTPETPPTDG